MVRLCSKSSRPSSRFRIGTTRACRQRQDWPPAMALGREQESAEAIVPGATSRGQDIACSNARTARNRVTRTACTVVWKPRGETLRATRFGQISQLNLISVAIKRLHLPPWKGKSIVARTSEARAPPWGKRPTPTSLPFSCLPRRLESARASRKKGGVHFWSGYPGRRCAWPGLLSYRPYRTSVGSLRSQMLNAARPCVRRAGHLSLEKQKGETRRRLHAV